MKNEFRNNLLLILIIIVMVGIYALSIDESKESTAPAFAKNGILNLDNWNWSESKIVTLNGEWRYYPNLLEKNLNAETNSLIKTVPHFWEKDSDLNYSPYGFGTYRLQVTGLEPLHIYGFEILDEVTAYRLYANDVLIASNGIVSKEPGKYLAQWHPEHGVFQADKNGNTELVMEIANYNYYRGGFWNSVKIGYVNDILAEVDKSKIFDMFLFTSIFIVGVLNLFLFLIYRRDQTILYFALFCFCMSFRTLLIGQRLVSEVIPILNWNMLVRLEYLLGYLLLPLFGLFVIHLFENNANSVLYKWFFKIYIICCFVLALILPNAVYTAFLEPYKWASVLFVLYLIYLFTKAITQKQPAAKLMIIVALGMMISIIKEVLGGTMSWMPFGTLIFIICFSLITFQRFLSVIRENDILETKVILDPLTGLHNRNYLMEFEKNNSITQNQNKYAMFLDLDSFKEINDTYGHKTGDYILQETGHRLKNYLRNTDVICRYGGDEFIIIFDSRLEDIKKIAERIIQIIQEPIEINGSSYSISVSIGISEIDADTQNIETLIKNSDKAMYEAKRNGGNQYFIWQNYIQG